MCNTFILNAISTTKNSECRFTQHHRGREREGEGERERERERGRGREREGEREEGEREREREGEREGEREKERGQEDKSHSLIMRRMRNPMTKKTVILRYHRASREESGQRGWRVRAIAPATAGEMEGRDNITTSSLHEQEERQSEEGGKRVDKRRLLALSLSHFTQMYHKELREGESEDKCHKQEGTF